MHSLRMHFLKQLKIRDKLIFAFATDSSWRFS